MTVNFHDPILPDEPALPATFNDRYGQLDDALTKLSNGTTAITPVLLKLNLGSAAALTIAAGAITVTRTRHTVDTEASAASDDLDTISGGSEGDLLVVQAAATGRTVVVRHLAAGGNIYLKAGANTSLNDARKAVMLLKSGATWIEV